MNVLVPVRQPLTDRNVRAIRRAFEVVDDIENHEVVVLYVNELLESPNTSRDELRQSVEDEFGEVPVSYIVRNGFTTEEAILDEAIRLGVGYVVVSQERRSRWERLLNRVLDREIDLERVLQTEYDIRIESTPD